MDPNTIDPQVKSLVQAIGATETGPQSTPEAYQQKGASGEFGRYQFMPDTYKTYAQKYLGDPNAAPTIENQNRIAYDFVNEKKNAGYNPAQIASMWNAGEAKPDAYKESYSGTNAEGVSYDTPAYVKKVSGYYEQFKNNPAAQSVIQDQQNVDTGQPQQQDQQNSGVENNIIPKIEGIAGNVDNTLSNMHGVLGSLASGAYRAGKGLVNLGKDAVVDLFNTVNHPIDTAKKVGSFVGEELNGGADTSHLDSIGQLVQSTVGSKGALGAGEEIGKLITDTTGQTKGAFSGGQLAGDTINTLLTAITGGESGLGEQAVKGSIQKAVENNIITDAMGKTLTEYATGLAGKSVGAAGIGAGFQAGTNLQEGKPLLQGTGQAAETGLFVPGEAGIAGKAASAIGGIIPHVPFVNGADSEKFNTYVSKAFPTGTKEAKLGDEYFDASKDIMNHIVANQDSIGITDKSGDIIPPSKYTMGDNLEALNSVKPGIYKAYTSLLDGADLDKFKSNIQEKTGSLISDLKEQQKKTISIPNKQVISTMVKELSGSSMSDATPLDLQNHIQDLGRRAFSGNMTEGKAIIANTAGKLKDVLDNSLDEFTGKQYKELKTTYRAAKLVESPWTKAALREIKATPGLTEKLASLGMTAEGIQFLLTHDPNSIIVGLGLKAGSEFVKWLKSPNRAMSNAYKVIEQQYRKGSPQ